MISVCPARPENHAGRNARCPSRQSAVPISRAETGSGLPARTCQARRVLFSCKQLGLSKSVAGRCRVELRRLVASGGALRNRQGNRVANFADRECTLCGSEQTAKKIALITEWSQSFIYTPPVDRSQRRTRITTFRVIAVSVSTVCAQEESAPAKSATGMNTDKRIPGMQENMKATRGMGGHTMMSGGVHDEGR